MITLTLAASLASLLPEHGDNARSGRRSITIDANNWPETVDQIRHRFAQLANHVFDESGQLRSGLLIAVNDEVTSRSDGPPQITPNNEVFLFTQIAGG
jgi:hypothetical protein